MLTRLRPRLTFANVVSVLALFVALGGSAYAALSLPRNSVGSKQIRRNAVTSSKVKNHSLRARDVRGGQFATPGQLAGYLPRGGTATNANKVGNLAPSAFERATRIQYGRGVGSSSTSTVIFSWPEIGLEVMTDGDVDQNAEIRLHNTGPGGLQYALGPGPGAGVISLNSGDNVEVGTGSTDFILPDVYVMENGAGRMILIHCVNNVFGASDGQMHCYGFRSSPN
jgi:hypothetical protein